MATGLTDSDVTVVASVPAAYKTWDGRPVNVEWGTLDGKVFVKREVVGGSQVDLYSTNGWVPSACYQDKVIVRLATGGKHVR